MKTALIVRVCLICLILASAFFLALKMEISWKDKASDYSKQKNNSSNKANVKIGNAYNDYEAVPIEITRVQRRDIEIFLVNNCTLEPEKQVDVVAKITGIVNNITAEEGAYVKTGETLAKLDDEESSLALSDARIKKENTARIYRRSLENFKDNIISREEFEERKFQHDSALIEFEKKQLEYKYTTIKSPIDGVVINRNIDIGYNVEKDQIVFKIADFDPILAKIYVSEKHLNKLELGQKARIFSEFSPEIELMGNVKIISPVVDPDSGTVKVTIEITEQTGGVLVPGMFVSVYIVVGRHQDALVIPKRALIMEAEDVFVARDFIRLKANSRGLQNLNIDDAVICKQNVSVKNNSMNKDDYAVSGKVIDISRDNKNKLPLTITIKTNDIIDKNANNVFKTVSFYNDQNTLILQIKNVAFNVDTIALKTKTTLGFRERDSVEVLTGLEEGDRVITVGQDDIGHGAHVIIVNEQ